MLQERFKLRIELNEFNKHFEKLSQLEFVEWRGME